MSDYNKEHKNAQCLSAQALLDYAEEQGVNSSMMMELLIKSFGLQCSAKLAAPRKLMLARVSIKPLIASAVKQAEMLYGASHKDSPALVAKQALYLLCGRDKSNKVRETCQQWRDNEISLLLEKAASKPKGKKAA
jgi:hypothetical protein